MYKEEKLYITTTIYIYIYIYICLEWLRGFQEVKILRFHDNGTG